MTPKEIIKAAYDRLVDEYDEDPRSPLIRGLESLLQNEDEIPADDRIELLATIQPGGRFTLQDQHGRPVHGVRSVSAYKDQSGIDVMQIIL